MQVTAVLPRYFTKIVYPTNTVAAGTLLCPRDMRRTYLRIVTGFAGLGANAGVYLDGTDTVNFFAPLVGNQVFEMKWIDVQVLVQSEIWILDVAPLGIKSVTGTLCIEEQMRYQYASSRPPWVSLSNPRIVRPAKGWQSRCYSHSNTRQPNAVRVPNIRTDKLPAILQGTGNTH